MTRNEKTAAVDEITELLESAPTVYITNYSGLTVEQANNLRGQFREEGIRFRVLKNTLVRLAMERIGGYDALFEHLHGPTAVAFAEDPSAPARVMKKFLSSQGTDLPEPACEATKTLLS